MTLRSPTRRLRIRGLTGYFTVPAACTCTGFYTVEAEQVRQETISRRRRERKTEAPPDSSEEAFLKIDGMHGSTCESFVESMSKRRKGINKSEASYATKIVKVWYVPERLNREELPVLFSSMGYTARPGKQRVADRK